MTRRHELNNHQHKLSEIRNIMSSMKTLAIMETHKLDRFISAHENMAKNIDLIASDFLQFNHNVIPPASPGTDIFCLIGSEHGFCGDFNQQLVKTFLLQLDEDTDRQPILISIGNKLHPLLSDQFSNLVTLSGADIAEEIFLVVENLSQKLARYPQPASLYVLHHNHLHNQLISERLLPPFQDTSYPSTKHQSPPLLNMEPKTFFMELIDHYLFSALHRIFYISLMIENQRRIQHLENALQHIDSKNEELSRKINALRQEEIIEEIEVILLNASSN
ncbi:MAG: F0F1 ATP synthase subunit gamma [Gammaproteobacteria bacterium]